MAESDNTCEHIRQALALLTQTHSADTLPYVLSLKTHNGRGRHSTSERHAYDAMGVACGFALYGSDPGVQPNLEFTIFMEK